MERTPNENTLKPPDWFIRLCRWFWGKRSFVWSAVILNILLVVIVTLLFTDPTTITKLPIGWAFQNPLIIVIVFLVLLSLTIISGVVSRLPQEARTLFMVEDLPGDFVPRPHEFEELITKLLDQARKRPIAITAALRGAGGYGKTTMAMALCYDQRIRRAFRDGFLWVTLGENLILNKLVGKVEDLIYTLNHERPGFTGLDAATARLVELLTDRQALIVVDDVWNSAHLKPFLQGGKRCTRLITTRDDSVLPPDAQRISVDAMQRQEAVQLLRAGVDGVTSSKSDSEALHRLAARLGDWPLLLKLANGVLRKQILRNNQTIHDALAYLNQALDEHGLTAFDARDAQDRSQAVAQTLGVSFGLLSKEEYTCYRELAVFPEDVNIPLATLQKLWRATGRLNDFGVRELCERLYDLSLLLNFDPTTRTIRLHDVIHSYLQKAVGAALPVLHAHLLDSYALTRWADLPSDEPYLWDHLADQLVEASRLEELIATVKDLRYLARKTLVRTAYAAEADLAIAEQRAPADVPLRLLRRNFANMGHLLNRCSTFNDLAAALYSRLVHLLELADLCQAFEQDIPRPYLVGWHPLPDLPDSALIRTLRYPALIRTLPWRPWHTWGVTGCAISPAGDTIVSASYDGTLKVWDAHTGEERHTLQGRHMGQVTGCAISSSGDTIVSASRDHTLKVWDARTGMERRTLGGHTGGVYGCAISPAGDFIVSASVDQALKVWDAHTGEERRTLPWHPGHTDEVTGCAISLSGDTIVSASADGTPKVWDARTGEERHTWRGHRVRVTGCAISPAGDTIVSVSWDYTLKVWDARTGKVRHTLRGHTNAGGCAISPSGDTIVSASWHHTLKVWDARTGEERLKLSGHTDGVTGCAISLSGDTIVSASADGTLKVWDAHTGEERRTLRGHTDRVTGCAISPSGDTIVSASYDGTLKLWDVRTGEERRTLRGHTDRVTGCAISPSGDTIVSASVDQALKVWDARTGACLSTLYVNGPLNACAFYPDGEHLVAAGAGGVYFLRWVR
jgi:WD40 repeat protein